MTPSFFTNFFLDNIRSKELKKRLIQLNQMHELLTPVTPIKTKGRVSSKYQNIVDDYHKLIERYNVAMEGQALMIELIIGLAYQVDYSTNPDTNDEIFSRLSKELRSEMSG